MAISDPEVGDDIAVVPVIEDGRGRSKDRKFAQFKLLASAQGVVVERWSDDIRVASAPYGVAISSPSLGLVLSGGKKTKVTKIDETDEFEEELPPLILNFVEWRGEIDETTLDSARRDLELKAS